MNEREPTIGLARINILYQIGVRFPNALKENGNFLWSPWFKVTEQQKEALNTDNINFQFVPYEFMMAVQYLDLSPNIVWNENCIEVLHNIHKWFTSVEDSATETIAKADRLLRAGEITSDESSKMDSEARDNRAIIRGYKKTFAECLKSLSDYGGPIHDGSVDNPTFHATDSEDYKKERLAIAHAHNNSEPDNRKRYIIWLYKDMSLFSFDIVYKHIDKKDGVYKYASYGGLIFSGRLKDKLDAKAIDYCWSTHS